MRKYIVPVESGLEVRSWIVDDSSTLFNLVDKNRDLLEEWLIWVPSTKSGEDTKKFINDCHKEYSKKSGLQMGLWSSDELIGTIGLNNLDMVSKKASIGYWLSGDHQGRGTMTKAVKSLIDFGFEDLGLNRIELKIAEKNIKSRGIAERLSFVKEGVLRADEFLNGEYLNYVVYSLLRSEWKSGRVKESQS